MKPYARVHRVCQQQQTDRNIPECVCSDGAVRAGGGGRVPAAATEERQITRGHRRGWGLPLHWKGKLSKARYTGGHHLHCRVLTGEVRLICSLEIPFNSSGYLS